MEIDFLPFVSKPEGSLLGGEMLHFFCDVKTFDVKTYHLFWSMFAFGIIMEMLERSRWWDNLFS